MPNDFGHFRPFARSVVGDTSRPLFPSPSPSPSLSPSLTFSLSLSRSLSSLPPSLSRYASQSFPGVPSAATTLRQTHPRFSRAHLSASIARLTPTCGRLQFAAQVGRWGLLRSVVRLPDAVGASHPARPPHVDARAVAARAQCARSELCASAW